MNNYEITLKVLKNIKQITPVCEESDTSRSAEDFRETHKALDKIMKLVESEMESLSPSLAIEFNCTSRMFSSSL